MLLGKNKKLEYQCGVQWKRTSICPNVILCWDYSQLPPSTLTKTLQDWEGFSQWT